MRFKYNPWVSMVAAILLVTILVLTCAGCVADTEAAERDAGRAEIVAPTEETEAKTTGTETVSAKRFTIEWQGFGGLHLDSILVITDNQTGVQYLLVKDNENIGLTKLEE